MLVTIINFETVAAIQLFELVSSESMLANINKASFVSFARYYDTKVAQACYTAGMYELYTDSISVYIHKMIDEFCIRFYKQNTIVTKDGVIYFINKLCSNIIGIINDNISRGETNE